MTTVTVAQWGTMEDAAAVLAVDRATIRRMISRREVEAQRFGPRLIRVNMSALASAGRPLQYVEAWSAR